MTEYCIISQMSHYYVCCILNPLSREVMNLLINLFRSLHSRIFLFILPRKQTLNYHSLITKTRLFKYIEDLTFKNSKKKNQIKPPKLFIFAQNIDCGYSLEPPRQGSSNKYPQSMFSSKNKKNNVDPCKPQFYYIKVGFKGVKII